MGIKQDLKKIQKEVKRSYPGYKVTFQVTRDNNYEQVARIWNKTVASCAEDDKRIGILNKFGYIYIMNRDDHANTLVCNFDELDYRRWIKCFFDDTVLKPHNPNGQYCFICDTTKTRTIQCQTCFKHACIGCCEKMRGSNCPYCRTPNYAFADERPVFMRMGSR